MIKVATRFVEGATQTSNMAKKKKSGIRMYCLKDRDDVLVGLMRAVEEA